MKHYILAILSVLFISSLCGCATEDYVSIVGQIEGTVIDGISKKVIESCEVISPNNGTSLTDSHGHFSFQEVIPGTIQLTYKRLGYETTMCEVVVHAGKTTPANISLNPEKADCKLSTNTTILDLGNRDGVAELILKNTSNQSVTYTIQCDATEISFDPQRGTIVGQNSSIIKVAVDRTELSEGHYERTASIVTADSSIDIQIVFDKGLETRPTVTTISLDQDDTEQTTLVAKGAITSVGSSNIIQHGFCYSTQPEPSLVENEGIIKLGSLSSPANYTYNIAKLDLEKQYYVRAYATNKQGTSYGEVLSILMERLDNISISTQDATSVTPTSAMLNAKIAGGTVSDFSEVGFYYGTTEKCEIKIVVDSSNDKATNSVGIVINSLKSDTKYFFKGYGIAKSGEKVGEVKSFQTAKSSSVNTEITCETESASNITVNSAVIHGAFTVSGALKIKEWGFYYGSNPTPSVKQACRTNSVGISTAGETMSMKLDNLAPNKDYYFQSYVIDEHDNIVKGSINSFTTLTEVKCETSGATNITTESVTLKGRIVSGSPSSISQYGFYYGATLACSQKCVDVMTSSDGSSFEANITNLDSDKTYYYKAFCVTPSGEKLGEPQSFHTIKITPSGNVTCNTGEASDITTNSAVIHGNFTVSGTLKIKEWGFYYGTSFNPSIRLVCETNNTPVSIFTKTLSYKIEKLSEGTTYYFQTYIIDELNNVCKGPVKTFTTSNTPIIVIDYLSISGSAESLGNVSGKLSGKATLSPNGNSILEAGFIYRTDGYDLDLSTNYNGKTVKVPCEIIANSITLNNETVGGYLGGAYVRAYMILANGSIIYNGPKIYVASGMPYHRN